jgi:signal transduction histidine kinase
MGGYESCHQKVAAPEENPPWHGEEQEFLRGLINGMRCGILAIDREGHLVMLNEIGAQILGLDDMPPTGTPIGRALPSQPQLAQLLSESFDMASLPNRAEIDLNPGTSDCRTIGFTLSMVSHRPEEPAGAAIFFKDLTQIEHKEEQERLKDRLAALGQMAASLAHEIRNPLAAIEVTCSLLKRRLEPHDEGARMLEKITAEVSRLNRTITSSLEFVRPVSLNLAPARLTPLLEEAITVASERRGGPGIGIERRFDDSLPPMMMDSVQLRQVFENLVLNALEAVGTVGTVTVEAIVTSAPAVSSIPYLRGKTGTNDPWQHFDNFAIVRVSDTGPGIEEKNRNRIFYPFYTTKKQGSGVGLSMAKKIVNSHRGTIDIDRSPGGGAVFTVRLPMAPSPAEE